MSQTSARSPLRWPSPWRRCLRSPLSDFLELQRSYDLAKARISARPDPRRNTRAQLFSGLPVGEMIKRGWIDASDVRDVPAVEAALAKFFGVPSPDEIEILPHAAKKTMVSTEVTPVQLAWLYRVKEIASEMMVARYSRRAVRAAVPKLSALLAAREEARKVPRILTESGISLCHCRVVVVSENRWCLLLAR